jgi:hypothetical protein
MSNRIEALLQGSMNCGSGRGEMNKRPELNPSGLAKIRQRFDPAYSYMVFVRKARRDVPAQFREVTLLFNSLKIPTVEQEVHENIDSGNIALVVKLDPGEAAKISQELVNISIPSDLTYIFYGSQFGDTSNGSC